MNIHERANRLIAVFKQKPQTNFIVFKETCGKVRTMPIEKVVGCYNENVSPTNLADDLK